MKHRLFCLILVLAAVPVFCSCGKSSPEGEKSYFVGEDSVASAASLLGDRCTLISESETSDTGVYTYSDADPAAAVEAYAAQLQTEGFIAVDDEGNLLQTPDFTQATGQLRLAKAASTDGRLFSVSLEWTSTVFVVSVGCTDGVMADNAPLTDADGMTMEEAVDYLLTFSPAQLGLEGESMQNYDVLPLEGAVFVDGNACLRLSVYQEQSANQISKVAGTYFISGDRRHIYRLDSSTSQVTEITGSIGESVHEKD